MPAKRMIRPRRGRPAAAPVAAGSMLGNLAEAPVAAAPQPPREAMQEARAGTGRSKRIPLGGKQQQLTASNRPGYQRRWVNDNEGRLERAQAGGYEFVQDTVAKSTDTGTHTSQVVGSKKDGSPMRAYLMELPGAWYAEDQAAKQAEVDKVDVAIRAGGINGTVGVDGRYVPKSGISVKDGLSARPAPSSIPSDNGD